MPTPALHSILDTARLAVIAHQTAVSTISNNIANANTEGYTRRRADLVAVPIVNTGMGALGGGVRVRNIEQARDTLLDRTVRSFASGSAGRTLFADTVAQVEGILAEPSDHALGAAMDEFFNAYGDLANNPGSSTAKTVIAQQAHELATVLNTHAARLGDLEASVRQRFGADVREVNTLAAQVVELNRQIATAEVGGQTAGDLRDLRGTVLDKLAAFGDTRVVEHSNGMVGVYLGGQVLLDGTTPRTLTSTSAVPPVLSFNGMPTPIANPGGRLGAAIDLLTVGVPGGIADARAQLDTVANILADTVNSVQATGFLFPGPPPGVPANPIFVTSDGAPIATALTIRVNGVVMANPSGEITASAVAAGPTDNSLARQMGSLLDITWPTVPAGKTLRTVYTDVVAGVGIAVGQADTDATIAVTLSKQATARREGVHGVNLDEEMIALTKAQQAYQAAAKIVTVADEMIATLINMV